MHWPFKGIILAEPKGSLKGLPTALLFQAAAKAAVFLCLVTLATRERVYVFFQRYLIIGNVFLKLVPYVFLYRFFVPSHSINIVSPAPEMSVAIPVFHICMPVKNHETLFPFRYPTNEDTLIFIGILTSM